jgi:hypothetical protein
MSRSGYSDDESYPGQFAMWKGQVLSATRGKRGQKLLRELAEAMDAMPVKELIAEYLESGGAYCALGVVGAKRGLDLATIDTEDPDQLSRAFDIAPCLAQEIEFVNDDDFSYRGETPAQRWTRVRKWVAEQIKQEQPPATPLHPQEKP